MEIEDNGFLHKHGGYKKLISFKKAEIIYDATLHFTGKYFNKYDRTKEQMIQAARSGKQNIAEGSMASAVSKHSEILLTNVAKASLEELKVDYEDFLRTNNLPSWGKDDIKSINFRKLSESSSPIYDSYKAVVEHDDPEIAANSIRSLIFSTIYLLGRQIQALEKAFIENGGVKERMAKARLDYKFKK